MPGNTVKINKSKEFEWYVGDSKMEELIKYLDKIGTKEEKADDLKGFKTLLNASIKKNLVCPHCGRCPLCGRRYFEPYPYYPYPYYPEPYPCYPRWIMTTGDGSVSITYTA